MKKSILVIVGVLGIVSPILLQEFTIIGSGNDINNNKITYSFNYNSNMFTNPFEVSSNKQLNENPKGVMEYVTHYNKRHQKSEKIDIYLDSQTLDKEDYCFMMVSIYNSLGELEYRLDTTTVYFKGSTHYEIEMDEPTIENETERKICVSTTFYSNPEERHQYIEFIVEYPNEEKEVEFNNNMDYEATYPLAIRHTRDGKEEKIYEKYNFDSICNLSFEKPIFDINNLFFKYDFENNSEDLPYHEECYLLIDDLYDESDFEVENEMKKVPLNLVKENGMLKFNLINNYFYDSLNGMIYENNETGRRKITKLFLPTSFKNKNESIYYELHLKNFGSSKSDYVFKSYATFDINWFGTCGSSLFCVESHDDTLDNAYYSIGVTI